ncbi:hypothetical protein [Aquimarina sp. SS2-1]|uniref:hypothetical protein n=1 Tax=Aquimarina besae TaxID=3342247 RepID=UPI0036726740
MIRKEGQFHINRERGISLGIESSNMENCISEYNKQFKLFKKGNPYTSIFGHKTFGFKESNLDFLEHFKRVENIWFWDVNLSDIQGLYYLKNLKSIGLTGKRPSIDFSQFTSLKEITIDWETKDYNLEQCENVENFYLWHHKPKERNFNSFKFPINCNNNASLNWTNVEDLTTLNGLKGLKKIEIHRSRNLKSLKGLEKYSETLEQIIITTSGKLEEYEFIKEFPKLKKAYINKKIIVE